MEVLLCTAYLLLMMKRRFADLSENMPSLKALRFLQAVDMCRENDYDIVIMDVMMPELDGFSACTEIRKFSSVPMIMLSARGEEYDRIHGFENGVDDYVVKPFSPRELMMRVNAIIKRYGGKEGGSDLPDHETFTIGKLSILPEGLYILTVKKSIFLLRNMTFFSILSRTATLRLQGKNL